LNALRLTKTKKNIKRQIKTDRPVAARTMQNIEKQGKISGVTKVSRHNSNIFEETFGIMRDFD